MCPSQPGEYRCRPDGRLGGDAASMRSSRHVTSLGAIVLAGVTVLSGCTPDAPSRTADGRGPSATAAAKATVEITPADGTTRVRPDHAVRVKVSGGTLAQVDVTTGDGTAVPGALSADRRGWRSTGSLAPGTAYRVRVRSTGPRGAGAETGSSFTTLTPKS